MLSRKAGDAVEKGEVLNVALTQEALFSRRRGSASLTLVMLVLKSINSHCR